MQQEYPTHMSSSEPSSQAARSIEKFRQNISATNNQICSRKFKRDDYKSELFLESIQGGKKSPREKKTVHGVPDGLESLGNENLSSHRAGCSHSRESSGDIDLNMNHNESLNRLVKDGLNTKADRTRNRDPDEHKEHSQVFPESRMVAPLSFWNHPLDPFPGFGVNLSYESDRAKPMKMILGRNLSQSQCRVKDQLEFLPQSFFPQSSDQEQITRSDSKRTCERLKSSTALGRLTEVLKRHHGYQSRKVRYFKMAYLDDFETIGEFTANERLLRLTAHDSGAMLFQSSNLPLCYMAETPQYVLHLLGLGEDSFPAFVCDPQEHDSDGAITPTSSPELMSSPSELSFDELSVGEGDEFFLNSPSLESTSSTVMNGISAYELFDSFQADSTDENLQITTPFSDLELNSSLVASGSYKQHAFSFVRGPKGSASGNNIEAINAVFDEVGSKGNQGQDKNSARPNSR